MEKKITMTFYNKFNGEYLGGTTGPYNRVRMMNGWYRKYWLRMKPFLASQEKIDKHWVRLKLEVTTPHI